MTYAEFRRADAGEQREQLATMMAEWLAAEFMPPAYARRVYAFARVTARQTGLSLERILDNARFEGELLNEAVSA